MQNKIAQVVFGLPVEGPFDYSVPENMRNTISVGMRVRVLFNRKRLVGFVVGLKEKSEFEKLNPIITLLEDTPSLDDKALSLCRKISEYYGCTLGEAMETYLPLSIRKGSYAEIIEAKKNIIKEDIKGYDTQISRPLPVLAYGVSCDKRWEFIFDKIKSCIDKNKHVLFLVPEITEIDKAVSKLKKIFSEKDIAAFDKKVTAKNELELWLKVKKGDIKIVIGTRSCVFAPVPDLGLIVVHDEESDFYKQEQAPHYHVREVVLMRADIEHCDTLFVSEAPSIEIWQKAKKDKWEKTLFSKAENNEMQIIDMLNYNPQKSSIISFPLQNDIQKFLGQNKKVALFINRKGFSTLTQCNQCGASMKCPRCDVNLSFISSDKMLTCRHCNFKTELPKVCPQCNGSYMSSKGTGVEKLKSEAARLYPQAKVVHFDSTTESFFKNADIIVATQAVLRVRELFEPHLVAIINFDSELSHFDFRSANKAFSLLMHLRFWAKEKFLVQTRMRDSYCIKSAMTLDFDGFFKEELKARKDLDLPPCGSLVSLTVRGIIEEDVLSAAKAIFSKLKENAGSLADISGPNPDVNPKLRDKYRYSIVLKGRSVKGMLKVIKDSLKGLKKKRGVVITVNVD